MGATFSYLSYASHRQSYPHEHGSQQLHQCFGPTVILGNGDTASSSFINLCIRLAALENNLETIRAENINKEATIQYLLQININHARVKDITAKLEEQLLTLKKTLDHTEKENKEIKHKLRIAEDTIATLSPLRVPNAKSQSTSTSLNSCRDSQPKSEVVTGDLIDLLNCNHKPDSANSIEENTTLLDECYEDELDVGGVVESITPDQSLHQSSDSDLESFSYIFHFTGSDEHAKWQDAIKVPSKKDWVPHGSSDLVLPLQQKMDMLSSISDASEVASFGISNQAEPSRPTGQTLTKMEDMQTSVGDNTAEPRWNLGRILDSAQDRESAALINKRMAQTGARDAPYPEFFKYGIRYVPNVHEQDFYRTVAISGLPPSTTMMALLERVRGGVLVDAKLLDTAKITGSNTALVTFLHERSAMAYEDHAKKHPIAFGTAAAHVTVVSTPTWPIPISLRTSIEEFGRTRCLEVYNIPRGIFLPTVRQELTANSVMKSNSLEYMRLGVDGVLGLRFSSISAAGHSTALLTKTLRYRGCSVRYIPDPCAQPLETLLEQRKDISEVVGEVTLEPCFSSETKATADEVSSMLTKANENIDSKLRRGRDRANCTIDGFINRDGRSMSPSSIRSEEPLHQETAATIASLAKSFYYPSE